MKKNGFARKQTVFSAYYMVKEAGQKQSIQEPQMKRLDDDRSDNDDNMDVFNADFSAGPISTSFNTKNEVIGATIAGGLIATIAVGVALMLSKD